MAQNSFRMKTSNSSLIHKVGSVNKALFEKRIFAKGVPYMENFSEVSVITHK